LEEAHRNPGSFSRIVGRQPDSAVSAYRYSSETAEYLFWFGQSGNPWRQGAVSSDAEFVCWRQKPDGMLILCDGSYAGIDGGLELRFRRKVSWGEVVLQGGSRTVLSSDLEAVQNEAVASEPLS
jgi:tRNA G37 N-methylase TrmD